MKEKARRQHKTAQIVITIFSSMCLIITVVALTLYMLSFSVPDAAVHVNASHDVGCRVYYVDNDTFGSGIRPQGQNYLLSFTDFIEIDDSLSADFGKTVNASYQYTATVVLAIRHQRGSDQNANPIVFEEKRVQTEIRGSVTDSRITLRLADNQPDGAYRIDPTEYISIYRHFVEEQQLQMQREGITTDRSIRFSADLTLDFTCRISIPEYGIDETSTRCVCIPLSNEVYAPDYTGTPELEATVPAREFEMPGLPVILLLAVWFTANIFAICYCVRKLISKENTARREAEGILRKYSGEMILLTKPANFSKYELIPVPRFQEIVKLTAKTGRYVLCFHNQNIAEFYAVADGYAYCYSLTFDESAASDHDAQKNTETTLPSDEFASDMEILMDELSDMFENK